MRIIRFGAVVSAVLFLGVFLVGCATKDAAAETVMTELDSLTTDMVKEIEASPNDAGIDRALKLVTERQDKIKAAVKDLKAGLVSDEVKAKYDASVDASFKKFVVLGEKRQNELFSDEKLGDRFISMIDELKKLFTGE